MSFSVARLSRFVRGRQGHYLATQSAFIRKRDEALMFLKSA